ncbi:MAG: hypothetical protein K2P78_00955 [Gemmataceae bacterium]|nr:hypothetical protein [Gemmataceae bacterium]
MILLDSDVLLIDIRYQGDQRSVVNRQALDRLRRDGHAVRVTTQVILEVVGVLSFRTPAADVPLMPDRIKSQYGLEVLPDPTTDPDYAGCTVPELLARMAHKMALGDAILAVQVGKHAPAATALLTWNAKHFRGKLAVPVLTPEEWLNLQPPAAPTP